MDAALLLGYQEIMSVECHPDYYARCLEKYKDEPRVRLWYGPSPECLKEMIDPEKSTTFYLDAHFMGGHMPELQDRRHGQCPLLAEIDVINSFYWKQAPIIVVDDWANFHGGVGEGYIQEEWPLWSEVEKRLPNYKIEIERGIAWCLPRDS